jgi:hypothetical protein
LGLQVIRPLWLEVENNQESSAVRIRICPLLERDEMLGPSFWIDQIALIPTKLRSKLRQGDPRILAYDSWGNANSLSFREGEESQSHLSRDLS